MDFIKIKNFCAEKDTIEKVKRKPTKWEKKFCISVHLFRVLCIEYIKNNSTIKKKRQSLFKGEQRI